MANTSGVTLTFDMHPKWEQASWWLQPNFYGGKNIFDILDDYGVRATFFVSQFDKVKTDPQWQTVIDRVVRSHEIGGHTLTHPAAPGSNPIQYWYNQIYPNYLDYLAIRSQPGHQHWPAYWSSFAYPNTQADAVINEFLLKIFTRLRGANPSDGSGPMSPSDMKRADVITAGWLDRFAFTPPMGSPAWENGWKEWVNDTAKINGYVVFASHLPSWYAGNPADPVPKYTDPSVLLEFLSHIKFQTDLPFVSMSQLPRASQSSTDDLPTELADGLKQLEKLRSLV